MSNPVLVMRSCAAAAAALCLLQAPAAAQSLAPARRLTLADAVELAQRQGHAARAAADAREAARYRYRAFNARLLPRLGLQGTVPDLSRAIVPVTQPDGS